MLSVFFSSLLFSFVFSAEIVENTNAEQNLMAFIAQDKVKGRFGEIPYQRALDRAAKIGRLDIVKYLVKEGPEDYRAQANFNNGEAMISATMGGHLDIVKCLVQEGPVRTRVPAQCCGFWEKKYCQVFY